MRQKNEDFWVKKLGFLAFKSGDFSAIRGQILSRKIGDLGVKKIEVSGQKNEDFWVEKFRFQGAENADF